MGAIGTALVAEPAEALQVLQIGPQDVGLQMPGGGQFTQGQTQSPGIVGAALQVAVELGDAQGTAGSMAAAVLLVQTAEGTVGVIDRSGADGVEAHAQGEESSIAATEATRGVRKLWGRGSDGS